MAHSHSHESVPMDTDEQSHQATVVATFDQYRQQALSANQRRRKDYYSLPLRHRDLLPEFNDLLSDVDSKLEQNARFVQTLVDHNPFPVEDRDAALSARAPTESDHERVRSTLRQCARDWSETGRYERETTYTPILTALEQAFPTTTTTKRSRVRVVVPGAGLGRLAWEINRVGFTCQANEFSLHMLIASNWILNESSVDDRQELYPYLHSFSNVRDRTDLLTPSWIPDVDPSQIVDKDDDGLERGEFSFAAGDFLELYGGGSQGGEWDACVTCFFIDTARSIPHYLETIYNLLKPGGVWINSGPSLWHFENDHEAQSIELTIEDVKLVAARLGFEFVDQREYITSYTTNPRSLLRHEYTCAFWIAKKPLSAAAAAGHVDEEDDDKDEKNELRIE